MQIKLIYTRKVLPFNSFWMWEVLEVENGLLAKDTNMTPIGS